MGIVLLCTRLTYGAVCTILHFENVLKIYRSLYLLFRRKVQSFCVWFWRRNYRSYYDQATKGAAGQFLPRNFQNMFSC